MKPLPVDSKSQIRPRNTQADLRGLFPLFSVGFAVPFFIYWDPYISDHIPILRDTQGWLTELQLS